MDKTEIDKLWDRVGVLVNQIDRLEFELWQARKEINEANEKLKKKYIPIPILEEWLIENGWSRYSNLKRTIFSIFPAIDCHTGYAIKMPDEIDVDKNCLSYDDDFLSTIASWNRKDLDSLMRELDVKILNNEK
jgi:hypothetical protein